MPGAEEVALFDRMGALIRGEDARFDLIVFDTAPTGHTLRLIRMPELMEAWIKALSRSRRAMLGVEQDDRQGPDHVVAWRSARAPARAAGAAHEWPNHRRSSWCSSPSGCRSKRPRARSRSSTKPGSGSGAVVNRVLPETRVISQARRRQEPCTAEIERVSVTRRACRSSNRTSTDRRSNASARSCFREALRGRSRAVLNTSREFPKDRWLRTPADSKALRFNPVARVGLAVVKSRAPACP